MFLAGRRRLLQLTDRVDELERELQSLRGLQVEWQDTLDRITRVMQRINRRAEREEAAAEPPVNPAAMRLLRPYEASK